MRKIKILAISALFPPTHLGGYEIRIKNIMDALSDKGHEVLVLSTIPEKKAFQKTINLPYQVIRKLHLPYQPFMGMETLKKIRQWGILPERDESPKNIFQNLSKLMNNFLSLVFGILNDINDIHLIEKSIKRFSPDIIYLGHLALLSKSILPYLSDYKLPMLYDEGGAGLIGLFRKKEQWRVLLERLQKKIPALQSRVDRLVEVIIKWSKHRIKPEFRLPDKLHVVFNSELNRNNALRLGVPLQSFEVIHSGIDIDQFCFIERELIDQPVSIILPGRYCEEKGQKDGVLLLKYLHEKGIKARLVMMGKVWGERYYQELQELIANTGVSAEIQLMSMIPHAELIDYYHQSQFCFFPSTAQTGFSRTPLEAMACGSVVISYGYEGSNEIISNGQNGFLVEEGDVDSAMQVIQGLVADPSRIIRVRETARHFVEDNHTLSRYVDRIEQAIWDTINEKCSLSQDVIN